MNRSLALTKVCAFREPIPGLFFGGLVTVSLQEDHSSAQADIESAKARNLETIALAAYYLKNKAGCDPDDVRDDWV